MSSPDGNIYERLTRADLYPVERDLLGNFRVAHLGDAPHNTSMYSVITGDKEHASPYVVAKIPYNEGGYLKGRNNTSAPLITSMGILALPNNQIVKIYFLDQTVQGGWKELIRLMRDAEGNYEISRSDDGSNWQITALDGSFLIGTAPDKSLSPTATPLLVPRSPTISSTQLGVRMLKSADGYSGIFLDNVGKNDVLMSPADQIPA